MQSINHILTTPPILQWDQLLLELKLGRMAVGLDLSGSDSPKWHKSNGSIPFWNLSYWKISIWKIFILFYQKKRKKKEIFHTVSAVTNLQAVGRAPKLLRITDISSMGFKQILME